MRQVLAAVAIALLAAGPAAANEKSEALDSRGAVELEQGRVDAALALFEQAVEADPNDAVAVYHRGVANAKKGRTDEAITDFERALALRPNFDEAALELGVILVETNRAAEGRRWLQQAQRNPKLEGQAAFFFGIASLREGDLDEARSSFEQARAKDPALEVTSRYYLGVVDYREGNATRAREHFDFVHQEAPETAVGREADAFLDLIRSGEGSGTQLYGSASFQYDTNVVLAPAEGLPQVAISDQADGRFTINAGGFYEAWRGENARLSVGYDFYQNLQFELTEFNLTDNRPSAILTYDFGPFQGGFLTRYDYYLLDFSNFLQSITAQPWLVFPEGDQGRTEVYLRYEWLDYLDDSFDILDGNTYMGGIRQVLSLGEVGREAWASFENESQVTSRGIGDPYSYNSAQGEIALLWTLPWGIESQAGYRFRYESYDEASAVFFEPLGPTRLDQEHRVGVAFRRPINELLSVVAAWIGTWNDSNKDVFDYTRQIGSIGVEVRY